MNLINFLLVSIATTSLTFAQCELLDIDGDGFIGGGQLVDHLANYGTDNPESDFNLDGIVGVEDIFILMPYIGESCSVIDGWFPETNDHVLGVVLEEYYLHETGSQLIPAGSTTYRVYVHLSDPTDQLIGVYGTAGSPLNISTDSEFYFDGFSQSNPPVSSYLNPAMLPFFPELEYSTFVAIDSEFGDDNTNISTLSDGSNVDGYWMGGPSQFVINTDVGGGWFNSYPPSYVENNEEINLQLVGQFTVLNSSVINGAINVQAKTTEVEIHDHVEIATGLTFSSDDITIWGCTDSTAINYNPEADFSDGSCISPADFDGDGTITIQDLLLLIENMGCTDCPDFDLNGDGIVNVFDLLEFLQQF